MDLEKLAEKTSIVIDRINQFKPTAKDWRDCLTATVESFGVEFQVFPKYDEKRTGITDGEKIYVYGEWGYDDLFFSIFHELGHLLLHFPLPKDGVTKNQLIKMEQEADCFSLFICDLIWPGHYDSFLKLARNNGTVSLLS